MLRTSKFLFKPIKWLCIPYVYEALYQFVIWQKKLQMILLIIKVGKNHEEASGTKKEVTRTEGRLQITI